MPLAVQRSFLAAAGAVRERVDRALRQFHGNALATLYVDGGSLRTGEVHAVEYECGLVCTVVEERAVGGFARECEGILRVLIAVVDGDIGGCNRCSHAFQEERIDNAGCTAAVCHCKSGGHIAVRQADAAGSDLYDRALPAGYSQYRTVFAELQGVDGCR